MSIDLISKRISKFLATNMRQEIDRAIAGSSFKRMREIGEGDIRARRVGIFCRPYLPARHRQWRSFHAQRAGDADPMLTGVQRAGFADAFGALMPALFRGLRGAGTER